MRGKPVAPADLNGDGGLILPQAVVIPIEVDLFERYGIPANSANYKGDIFIGEVVVDVASGRAIFNGQPLQREAEAELAARCQRILRDRVTWRAQLNVSNVGVGDELIPVTVQPDGTPAAWRIRPSQQIFLTNTFRF